MSYSLLLSDPPLPQRKGNLRKCRPNQGKLLDYPVLTVEKIFRLHERSFKLMTEKHTVFLWCNDKFLSAAEYEMKKLGYVLHARFVWDKLNGVAPAFTVRFCHAYLLWFYPVGRLLFPCREVRGKFGTVIREASSRHSCKPVAVYEMLECMFPGVDKAELFARVRRVGWDCFGNEVTCTPILLKFLEVVS